VGLYPGEVVARQAANAAASLGEAAASHGRAKEQNSAAYLAAASQDPSVVEKAEKSKQKRTTVKVIGSATVLLAFIGAGSQLANRILDTPGEVAATISDGLSDVADAIKPHELAIAEVQTTLDDITWDSGTPLLKGTATGYSHLHTERHLFGPFTQPQGHSDTYSARQGGLKLGINTLRYESKEISPGNFGLVVHADEEDLYVDLTNPTSLDHIEANDGFVRRYVGVVRGTNGDVRQEALTDYTDDKITQCVAAFSPALEASIKHAVVANLEETRDILSLDNKTVDVQALDTILLNPIEVVFDGGKSVGEINLASVADAPMTREDMASKIGSDAEYTTVDAEPGDEAAPDCTVAQKASISLINLVQEEEARTAKFAQLQKRMSRIGE
jgi:hypothetical protein